VTLDAMHCQKATTAAIQAKGADYVLTVKDNQPGLHAMIANRADNHDIRDFSARVFATQVPRREVNLGNGKARAVMPAGRSDFGDQQVLRFVRAQSCARLQQFLRSTGVSC